MGKSLKEVANRVLAKTLNENENAATLKPGSKLKEEPKKVVSKDGPAGSEIEDLGGPVVRGDEAETGASKAADRIKQAAKPGPGQGTKDAPKKLTKVSEDEEKTEEVVAESEESEEEVIADGEEVAEGDDVEADADEADEGEYAEDELPIEIDVTQDVEALFAGEELSEEFKAKAKLMYETAVIAAIKKYQAELESVFEDVVSEAVSEIEDALSEKVEGYVNYVAEQWMVNNEVAVESTLRNELSEDFIGSLRNVFVEHYIDIPEDKVSVVETLTTQLEDVEAKLNEEIARGIELKRQLDENTKEVAFFEATDGLTDVQVEKIRGLSESVGFTDVTEYTAKIKTLRESYFPSKSKEGPKQLDEDLGVDPEKTIVEEEKSTSPRMKQYLAAMGRSVPKHMTK